MKIECKRDIITDLSPDDVIFERFEREVPKLAYWVKKGGVQVIEPGCFPQEPLKVVDPDVAMFVPYIPLGVIKWQNIYNEDTWAIAVFHHHYQPYRRMHVCFYYWTTIGSIGFMTEMNIGTMQKQHRMIVAFSSHAMLRYKTRMELDITGFDLITYLVGGTYMNVPRVYERNGRETLEMICKDGVFRAPVNDSCVLTMKTFLSWSELNKRDYDEAKGLWEMYQKVFSE